LLCDPDVGVDFGCRKLRQCELEHGAGESALLAYNGGGNREYGKQVLARVAHYAVDVRDANDAQGAD
jgi:soluble lytic murein transglycosylase-like protein